MVSQFVSSHKVVLLGSLDYEFPEGTHAVGRLDNNSEGLLILTTNKSITKKLFQSAVPHSRTYLVQVKHEVTKETIQKLNNGVYIQVKGGAYYKTSPCNATLVDDVSQYYIGPQIKQPYEVSSWLLITLTEGKFHQVRKMVNAVGHRCKRLIRISIEDIFLSDLKPGCIREMEENDFFKALKISQ